MIINNKKSQLKIQEMAFTLIAIIFVFVLVGLFAFSIFYSDLHKQATQIANDNAVSSLINLANSAEFICDGFKTNCVDSDKALVLMYKSEYKNFWPFNSLYIIKESGFNKSKMNLIRCNILNYPSCDILVFFEGVGGNEKLISSFISLCRTEYENGYYEKCEVAKFVAGTKIINPGGK
jgi:hypothetical protein